MKIVDFLKDRDSALSSCNSVPGMYDLTIKQMTDDKIDD